jgi:NodT family efflux transporter outer membrane factor (OMF) lipoprotein
MEPLSVFAQIQSAWYGHDTAWTHPGKHIARAVNRVHGWSELHQARCSVGPAFKETSEWKEGDGWKVAQPNDTVLRGKWWELYGDTDLNELEQQVDPSNQTVKEAEANFRQARAAIRFNRAAEAPTIAVAPSISAVRASANQPYFTPSLVNNGTGDLTLPVDLSYEVDLWGRIRRTVTASKEQAQASSADLDTVRLSLHAEVAIDYFEVRSADAQKQLLDDTVKAYSDALQLTKYRFEGGAAPKADVAQAQTQLDQTRVQASDIMVQRAQYEHALAILIGKPPAEFHLPPVPINIQAPLLPDVPVTLPAQLLERRPDIAEAERRMAAANEQIGIAKAAYYPTLNIAAAVGLEGSSALNWFEWPSRFWAVGPALSETLFDAGRRRATTESAVAGYDGTVANYRQTVLNAYQQVEDNLVALHILNTESAQQHSATASAEESLQLSQNRYAGGLDTYLQVVIWQTAALTNERNDIDIMRRRLEANALLIKALGGGWDIHSLPRL